MLVMKFAGTTTSDAEYGEIVEALKQMHRDANGRVAFGVIIVPKGHAAPNAYWRSRFADAHLNRTGRYLFAPVTENPLIRGVFTAVKWLMRDKNNYHGCALATFDDAVVAFEKIEGRQLDQLRALLTVAEADLRKRRPHLESKEAGAT